MLLSTRAGSDDHARALDAGADAYFARPFSFVVMVAQLRALIRSSERASSYRLPRPIRVHHLWVDPLSRQAGFGERRITLTGRKFELLVQLASHPGCVLGTADLRREIWSEKEVSLNALQAQVVYLRQSLRDLGAGHILVNIPGQGYMVDHRMCAVRPREPRNEAG
jgi:DNA-binding response OmpR family regulator